VEIIVLLLIAVFATVVQGAIYEKKAYKKLDYTCKLDRDEVAEGEQIELVETVTNAKLMPIPWLKAEITSSVWLDFAGSHSVTTHETRYVPSFFMLKSYQKITRRWYVKCAKRGIHKISSAMLLTTDLLGQNSISKPVPLNSQITVLPRLAEIDDVFIANKSFSGDIIVKRYILDDPFYINGVRQYQTGDALNRIDWAATAKAQQLMVKNCEHTTSQKITVLLNMQSQPYEADTVINTDNMEYAISICAALCDKALRLGIPVGFAANASINGKRENTVTPYFSLYEHQIEILRILAKLELKSSYDFPAFIKQINFFEDSTDVIIVTTHITPEIESALTAKAGAKIKILLLDYRSNTNLDDFADIYYLKENKRKKAGEAYE